MGFWSETTQRSRKSRGCDECGQMIAVGETYTRGAGVVAGDFNVWVSHPDCLAATLEQRELAKLNHYDDWWPVSEWIGEMPPDALAELKEKWPGVYQRAVVDAQRDRDEEATYRLWNKDL